MALMDHYKDSLTLSTEAMNSSGQAMERYGTYAESTKAKMDDLKGSVQRFWQQTLQSSTINSGISGLNTLVNTFSSITNKIGVLPTLLTGILPILTQFGKFKDFKLIDFTSASSSATKFTQQVSILGSSLETIGSKFKTSFGSFGDNYSKNLNEIQGFNNTLNQTPTILERADASMKTLRTTTIATTVATGALKVAEIALNASLTMGLSLAIGYIVEKLSDWINKDEILAQKNQELLSSTNQSIQGHQSNVQSLSEMSEKYKEVYERIQAYKDKGLQPLTEDTNSLGKMNDQLAQKFPSMISGYTDTGHAILNLNGNLKNLIETEKQAAKSDAQKVINSSGFSEQAESEIKRAKDRIKQLSGTESLGDMVRLDVTHPVQTFKDSFASTSQSSSMIKQLNQQIEQSEKWYQKIIPYVLQLNEGYSKLNPTLQTTIKNWANQNTAFSKMNGEEIQKQMNSVIKMYSSNTTLPLINKLKDLNNEAKNGAVPIKEYSKEADNLIEQIKKVSNTDLSKNTLKDIFAIDTSKLPKTEADVKTFTKSLEEMKNELVNTATQIKQYQSILNDINSTGKLTDSDKKIIQEDPDLLPYLNNVGQLTDTLTNKINTLKQSSTGMFANIQIKEHVDNLRNLEDTYTDLHNRQNLSAEDQQKLSSVVQQLQNDVQGLTVSTNNDGQATIASLTPINNRITMLSAEGKYLQLVAQVGVAKANTMLSAELKETEQTANNAQARMQTYDAEIKKIESLINIMSNIPILNVFAGDVKEGVLGKYKDQYNQAKKEFDSAQESIKGLKSQISVESQGAEDWNKYLKQSQDALSGLGSTAKGTSETINNDFNPSVDGNTSKTKKNTEAQKAQKEAIDKVKEATKEYETELKNLDNIQTQLELNMSHMDDTSQKYRDSLQEEINLLQQKNGFLQKGIDLNNSQAGTLGGYTSAGGSQLGQQVVNEAERYLNTPYVWGGSDPSGFDCSGLVQYAYKNLGIEIGRTTYDQVKEGQSVSRENLQPGDLVFFGDISSPHHVGIYAGGGEMIESPHSGASVRVASVDRSDYAGARRIVSGGSSSSGSSASTSMPTSMTYKEMVDAAGSKYGIDPNLIAAVIEQESDWKTTEKSSAGAVGLMQLMSGTAEEMGLSADQRTDPLKNIMAGTKYLSGLINKYGEEKGIALYNTGEYGGGNYGYASSVESKKQAYASGSKSMSTTSADVTSDTDVLSELDSLNSKTEDYQKQMMQNASKMLDLQTKLYESNLKYYDQEASKKDKDLNLAKENFTYFEKDSNSLNDSSRQYMQQEYEAINAKNAILLQKQQFIENELKNNSGVYDEKTISQMKQDLTTVQTDIKKNLNDLHQAFKDWITDQVTYKTQGYKDNIDNYNSQLSLLNERDSGGSEAKVNLNEQILEQRRQVSNGLKDEITKVQDLYIKEQYGVTRELWANELKELNKQLIENEDEVQKTINTLRDAAIAQILDDVDKRLKNINDDLKNIERSSKDVGDNNTSQRLINSMNSAQDYVMQLKEYTKAYNDIYTEISKKGYVTTDDQKKLDDARSKIDSVNDSLQTTKQTITSLGLENAIKPFENSIEKIVNQFSKLDFELNMLSSTNYESKVDILSKQLELNNVKVTNIMDEYKKLSNESAVAGSKEAETLASNLTSVRDKLIEAAKEGKTLKSELADTELNLVMKQLETPKNKINQLEDNINFQTSMPSNVQGLLLGNNLNYSESDSKKELEQTEDISNAVDDINNKIADLQANTYDINSSDITNTIEKVTNTSNQLLKNINDGVNKINENNNKSVTTKQVFGRGVDMDNAKSLAFKYGISDLFNFINTESPEYLQNRDKYKITNNDILLGGKSVTGVDSNDATRLAGIDRDKTKWVIDDYMKSLADVLKKSSTPSSDSTTEKTNEKLLSELGVNNTTSSTIANNTAQDVQVTQVQTTTLVKSEEDVAKSVNDNINSNFVTMEELTRNVKDTLTSIKDVINALKELEDKDLTQIVTDLKVIDTKTIIAELKNLHGSVNNLGNLVAEINSGENKNFQFVSIAPVDIPDYNKTNNKEVSKKANGGGTTEPWNIVGDGNGEEGAILPNSNEVIPVGQKGWTLQKFPFGTTIIKHEDFEKIKRQGGIIETPHFSNGTKYKIYAKDFSPDSTGVGDYDYAMSVTDGIRDDIQVVKYRNPDEPTQDDYILGGTGVIPSNYNINESHRIGGKDRTETHQLLDNWLKNHPKLADSSDVQIVDNPTTIPDSVNKDTTGNHNKVTGETSDTSNEIDYTKLEDTDYRKQLNKDINDVENKYTNQLQNGASNSDLLNTEINLENKKILLNNEGIQQLEQKKKLEGLTADDLAKINEKQISLNKEMQESQKKINDLAKEQVNAITEINDAKEKQLETNVKLIGSTSTKDELENDKRKLEILKEETIEYENQENALKKLQDQNKNYLNDLQGFSSDKLSTEENTQLKDLILKQNKNGYLESDDQSKLKSLENKLTTLDPDKSLNLQKIIDLLTDTKDKINDVKINSQTSKEKIDDEEYNTASQIIQNKKSLDEKQFEVNKKTWQKQLFSVSDEEFEQYKSDTIAKLQKEKTEAQESLKTAKGEDVLYYQDEILAKSNEIANISNQNYSDIYNWEQTFEDVHNHKIEQLDKENEELQEQETRQKNLLTLAELELKLKDTQNEKNVQQLVKDKNGNWQFQYVANQPNVDDLEKQVRDQIKSNSDYDRQQKISDEKKYEQNLINTQKSAYDKLVNDQQHILDEKYNDMNYLTQQYLEQIKTQVGGDSSKMLDALKSNLLTSQKNLEDFITNVDGQIKEMFNFLQNLAKDSQYQEGTETKNNSLNKTLEERIAAYRNDSEYKEARLNYINAKNESEKEKYYSQAEELTKKYGIKYDEATGNWSEVAQAENGGMTPSNIDNDGKLMFVHKDELINNKIDTENILSAAKYLDNINNLDYNSVNTPMQLMPNINVPSMGNINNTKISEPSVVHNDYHYDNITLDCPNVVDGQSFIRVFKELPNLIGQETSNIYNK